MRTESISGHAPAHGSARSDERRETVLLFRGRLQDAMDRAKMSKSALAREIGVDRSTLSQLLAPDNDRLPRADTVAAAARALNISLDWLMGLSAFERSNADILHEFFEFAPSERTPVDANIAQWHAEAMGQKIRYVPATLPELFKTEATIEHEFRDFAAKTTRQAKAASEDKRAFSRMPSADMEMCMPVQALRDYAAGAGIWRGVSVADRREQLLQMAQMADALYPKLRFYLFDGLTHYSAPYTIFGVGRAAVYLGQMFFAFTTLEHVRVLTNHFDDLIRAAVVHSHEVSDHIRAMVDALEEDGA